MTAIRTDEMRDRIAAYAFPRGGVEVVRANRGYTLYSRRTNGPVARLSLTSDGDKVQVTWWRHTAWAALGDFGSVVIGQLDFLGIGEPVLGGTGAVTLVRHD